MGLARLKAISEHLIASGCKADMPAAVVSRSTWPDAQVRVGTIEDIVAKAEGMRTPALLVLGEVVAFPSA
jgi:siroheme synthase